MQVAEQVGNAAKAGTCALLTVELDRRPGEETPRVTIRSLQTLDGLAKRSRLQIDVEVADGAALRRLAAAVAAEHGGTGELRLKRILGPGAMPTSSSAATFCSTPSSPSACAGSTASSRSASRVRSSSRSPAS